MKSCYRQDQTFWTKEMFHICMACIIAVDNCIRPNIYLDKNRWKCVMNTLKESIEELKYVILSSNHN